MHKLNTVYLAMLNNVWDIENQLTITLPKISERAHSDELKKSIIDHTEETQNHKIRLEELLQHHSHELTYERDMAFETLIKDALSDVSLIDDNDVSDAFFIASLLTVEHIEISRYTTLTQWAKELGDTLGTEVLTASLNEEESARKQLNSLATGGPFSSGANEKAAIT